MMRYLRPEISPGVLLTGLFPYALCFPPSLLESGRTSGSGKGGLEGLGEQVKAASHF